MLCKCDCHDKMSDHKININLHLGNMVGVRRQNPSTRRIRILIMIEIGQMRFGPFAKRGVVEAVLLHLFAWGWGRDQARLLRRTCRIDRMIDING